MELRVLNYFLVVAQESNITTAAARLHIGQPTLSRQLKDLERELGQSLFVRQSHGIRLTEEGRLLQSYATQMVELANRVERDFASMSLEPKPLGEVRLGGIDAYFDLLAEFSKLARDEQPTLTIHYSPCSATDALALVDHGLLDFALVSSQANLSHYATLEMPRSWSWIAYMREDHPLANKDKITREDLAGQSLLTYDQALKAPFEDDVVAAWLGEDFSNVTIAATSNLSSMLRGFASEGLGILLTWGRPREAPEPGMAVVPLDPPIEERGVIAWAQDRPLTDAAAYMLEKGRQLAVNATLGE